MSATATISPPKLRVHAPTGQAYVWLGGRRIYLGRHDKPETLQKYHQFIAEMLATGGAPPVAPEALTVKELLARFWVWAEGYYRKPDGTPTDELKGFKQTMRPLKELYADTPVTSFGPRALQGVRQRMIELKWCRRNINKHIGRIKHIFRWGTEQEMIPGSVYHAIQAVAGLRRGRSGAREPDPVKPVPLDQVNAIKPFVSRQVWAIAQLQVLCAARAGELVGMRKGQIDRSGEVWVYAPADHKTAHHGHDRRIYFGPKAKEILQPFLMRPDDKPLFSPAEAEKERREMMHVARVTPLSCGNRPGTNRSRAPQRPPGECYDVASYRRAISRACRQAFPLPESLAQRADETRKEWRARLTSDQKKAIVAWHKSHYWHPHQLRHTAATQLRKQFGLEAARIILGHRSAAITEVYAELDHSTAVNAMNQAG